MGDSSSRLSSNDLALRVCDGASGTILAALVCIVVLRITSVLGVNPGDALPEGGRFGRLLWRSKTASSRALTLPRVHRQLWT